MAQTVELARTGGGGVTEARAPGPDPLIGQHLLHYEVVEVIGQGGMSVVYRGRDQRLHRDVAIKVLHPFLAEKAECRQRLAREARAVARLEHPHILKVFDFSGEPATLDETPQGRDRVRGFAEGFIIAELVRGATLRRFAEDHDLWLCPEIGAMAIWQLARALEHAHEHGVVHRDLKPENVMVREDGVIKLMDFGIAHIADQKGLTVTGTLLGSPAHMAPECIDGHVADARSDLFSLGTVLYWICTGALPFEAHSPHALLKQIVEARALPAQQRSRRVSDDLAKVIAKAMARRPEDRYENAGAMSKALEETLERAGLRLSAEGVADILAHVKERLPEVQQTVRAAFLQRAEKHVEEGAAARAIGCLNRVLADNSDDAGAKDLLERAQGGLVDEPTDPAHQVQAPDSLVTSPTNELPRVDIARHADSQPPTIIEPASASFSRFAQKAALVAAALGLIGAAVFVSFRFDTERANDAQDAKDAKDAREAKDAARRQDEDGISLAVDPDAPDIARPRDPGASGRPDDGTVKVDKGGRDARDPKDGRTRVQDKKPEVVTPLSATRDVEIVVAPFADILVDDVLVAAGAKRVSAAMKPGLHRVTFRHQAAMELVREVIIPADGVVAAIQVELEPKPALVSVDCNVMDALVTVGDVGGMSARETLARPLLYAVSEKTFRARPELTVYKKGFTPFSEPLDLVAGARVTKKVVLEPVANGAAPANP